MNVDLDQTGKTYWGRLGWATIHTFASTSELDPMTKTYFLQWISALAPLLPCKSVCSGNLKANLQAIPLGPKETLLDWTYRLHDAVNRENGKLSPQQSVVTTYYRASRVQSPTFYLDYLFRFLYTIAYDYNHDIQPKIVPFVVLTGLVIPDSETRMKWKEFTDAHEIKMYLHHKNDLVYYFYMMRGYIQGSYMEPIDKVTKDLVSKFDLMVPAGECPTCGK